MSETKIDSFNTKPLVLEIENVIKNGLKNILKDFMNRYNLLEKTHQKIMRLPSVKNELNIGGGIVVDDSDSDDEFSTPFSEDQLVSCAQDIYAVESKLDQLEKKYDIIEFIKTAKTICPDLERSHSINKQFKSQKLNFEIFIKPSFLFQI